MRCRGNHGRTLTRRAHCPRLSVRVITRSRAGVRTAALRQLPPRSGRRPRTMWKVSDRATRAEGSRASMSWPVLNATTVVPPLDSGGEPGAGKRASTSRVVDLGDRVGDRRFPPAVLTTVRSRRRHGLTGCRLRFMLDRMRSQPPFPGVAGSYEAGGRVNAKGQQGRRPRADIQRNRAALLEAVANLPRCTGTSPPGRHGSQSCCRHAPRNWWCAGRISLSSATPPRRYASDWGPRRNTSAPSADCRHRSWPQPGNRSRTTR